MVNVASVSHNYGVLDYFHSVVGEGKTVGMRRTGGSWGLVRS